MSPKAIGYPDVEEPKEVLEVEAVLAVVEAKAKEVGDGMFDLVELLDSMGLRLFASPVCALLWLPAGPERLCRPWALVYWFDRYPGELSAGYVTESSLLPKKSAW